MAVEEGHTDMCLYLIEKKKLDVNFRDRNGWTPLHVLDLNLLLQVPAWLIVILLIRGGLW